MSPCCGPSGHDTAPTTRREFLRSAGGGFGILALASLLAEEGLLAGEGTGPAPTGRSRPARARQVILLFMSGGPSHLETFDPKPELVRLHGQRLPESFGPAKTRRGVDKNKLMGSKRVFRKHGQSGIEVSDLFPRVAAHADDLCVFRGGHGDHVTHPATVVHMNTR